jgi:hypothetical protein
MRQMQIWACLWLVCGLAASASAQHAIPEETGISFQPRLRYSLYSADPPLQMWPIYLNPRGDSDLDDPHRFELDTELNARLHANWTAQFLLRFDSDGRNQLLNRTRQFGQVGASNNIDTAYLRYQNGFAEFNIGRMPLRWGPLRHGGMMLSGIGPVPDALHGAIEIGAHRFEAFAGQLSSERDAENEILRRYLYGHRATLHFGQRHGTYWTIGISELAVVSGRSESVSLRYINPVQFYTQAQTEFDGDAATRVNALASADVELSLGGRAQFYGSLIVDDFQVNSEPRDRWPDQLAWALGGEWHPQQRRWSLGYEYRHVGSWTYLHRGEGTTIRSFFRPIGAPEGPDTERHILQLTRRSAGGPWENARWAVWIGGELRRRGENRLWTTESREGNVGTFPRGIVESRRIASAGARLRLGRDVNAQLHLDYQDIKQLKNVDDADEQVLSVRLSLQLILGTWRAELHD